MDVFNRHRRFIHQDANGERQPAERHDVDRLPGQPQPDQRREQRKWNCHHDNQCAPQVAQKEQHHQARQDCAERAFHSQPANRVLDVS